MYPLIPRLRCSVRRWNFFGRDQLLDGSIGPCHLDRWRGQHSPRLAVELREIFTFNGSRHSAVWVPESSQRVPGAAPSCEAYAISGFVLLSCFKSRCFAIVCLLLVLPNTPDDVMRTARITPSRSAPQVSLQNACSAVRVSLEFYPSGCQQ